MITRLFVWWFNFKGWTIDRSIPAGIRKAVVIAAPHTSNWDFVYALATFRLLKIKVRYLIKKEAYRFPLKGIIDATGGIPVKRHSNTRLVDTFIQELNGTDDLFLMIPAEGTRSLVKKWKSGFYHAALGADVPVLLGYLDFEKKTAGFGKTVFLTGDREKDMSVIREFYRNIKGKHPEKFDPESVRLDDE
jgi:1-acyl-sn-glycerol-3-phosphate acyltransferase